MRPWYGISPNNALPVDREQPSDHPCDGCAQRGPSCEECEHNAPCPHCHDTGIEIVTEGPDETEYERYCDCPLGRYIAKNEAVAERRRQADPPPPPPCPVCEGTKRCHYCLGSATEPGPDGPEPCHTCGGTGRCVICCDDVPLPF